MTGFLIGIVSGAIVGGLASYAKNPLSGQPLRKDVKETVDNFNDSCHRVKNIYHEMEEKNKEDGTDKSKAKVFVDAFSAASFKTIDHKKFFAAIKDKLNHDDKKAEETQLSEEKHATPTKVEGDVDSASGASEHEEKETPKSEKVEEKTDSDSGASQHEEKDENKD